MAEAFKESWLGQKIIKKIGRADDFFTDYHEKNIGEAAIAIQKTIMQMQKASGIAPREILSALQEAKGKTGDYSIKAGYSYA